MEGAVKKGVSVVLAVCLAFAMVCAPAFTRPAHATPLAIIPVAAAAGAALTTAYGVYGISTGVIDVSSAEELFNEFTDFVEGVSAEDVETALSVAGLASTTTFSSAVGYQVTEMIKSWGQQGNINLNAFRLNEDSGLFLCSLLSMFAQTFVGSGDGTGSEVDWDFPFFIEGADVLYDATYTHSTKGTFHLADFAVMSASVTTLPDSSINISDLVAYSNANNLSAPSVDWYFWLYDEETNLNYVFEDFSPFLSHPIGEDGYLEAEFTGSNSSRVWTYAPGAAAGEFTCYRSGGTTYNEILTNAYRNNSLLIWGLDSGSSALTTFNWRIAQSGTWAYLVSSGAFTSGFQAKSGALTGNPDVNLGWESWREGRTMSDVVGTILGGAAGIGRDAVYNGSEVTDRGTTDVIAPKRLGFISDWGDFLGRTGTGLADGVGTDGAISSDTPITGAAADGAVIEGSYSDMTRPGSGTSTSRSRTWDSLEGYITQIFPFCLVLDLATVFQILVAEPVAPSFEVPIKIPMWDFEDSLVLDLGEVPGVEEMRPIVHAAFLFFFVVGLIFLTLKFVNPKDGEF